MVDDVTRREDTGDVRQRRARFDLEVARLVVVELVEEEARVRIVTDCDEKPVRLDHPGVVGVDVTDLDAGHLALLAEHLVDDGVGEELDLRVGPCPVEHDRRGAELVATMHDGHLVGELREEDGLLHRRVAASDDDDVLLAEERCVADGAVGDAAALEGALRVETELPGARAGRDDDRPREVLVVSDDDAERPLGEVDLGHVVREVLGAEALRLRPEVLHHLGAEDAARIAGVVFDIARDHELAAEGDALDHEGVQVGAGSVERGRVPGRAAADDDQVSNVSVGHSLKRGLGPCVGPHLIQRIGPLEPSPNTRR